VASSNLKLARDAFDALAKDGVDAMLEYVHPDFEMETLPGIAAEPQVYSGHEGVRRWFESFYEVMDEIAVEPSSMEETAHDRIFVEFKLRARGQASGIEVQQEAQATATLKDDLLYRLEFLLPDSA
jgi:ketosteroid isomerase-like protein